MKHIKESHINVKPYYEIIEDKYRSYDFVKLSISEIRYLKIFNLLNKITKNIQYRVRPNYIYINMDFKSYILQFLIYKTDNNIFIIQYTINNMRKYYAISTITNIQVFIKGSINKPNKFINNI